jgi:hypothetical protein
MSVASSTCNLETLQPVQELVRLGALRWLHGIDLDPTSKTYGVADREFWSWKTKDFANGTLQAGLAGFMDSRPLLSLTDVQTQKLVSAVVRGTRFIQRRDGSFEEAYPYESSYCVTALVLFGLLYAYYRSPGSFTPESRSLLLSIVQSGDQFLANTPETHGVIANHLATGLMARYLAGHFLGTPMAEKELQSFLNLQNSTEGWFPEYGEADPGYQTLLNHYLSAGHQVKPLPPAVAQAVELSLGFVRCFCFPDGTFSGEVGGRGTGILYPSGTLLLADDPNAAMTGLTQWFVEAYAPAPHAVTPVSVDAGNSVPVWNAWALAWRQLSEIQEPPPHKLLPFFQEAHHALQVFQEAQLVAVTAPAATLALSLKNGAVRRVVKDAEGVWGDASLTAFTRGGFTTQGQALRVLNQDDTGIQFQYSAVLRNQPLNTALTATVLRLSGFLLHPFPKLQRLFKKALQAFVMHRKQQAITPPITVQIDFQQPDLPLTISPKTHDWQLQAFGYHRHMASANTFEDRAL